MLVVFNTDEINAHELYSTLNPNLNTGVRSRAEASPCHALPRLQVERRGVLCTRLALGLAGIAIYAAERFPRIGRE
jgi:hypothetical protein